MMRVTRRRASTPLALVVLVAAASAIATGSAAAGQAVAGSVTPNAVGLLDCNGLSPIQEHLGAIKACTDLRGQEHGVPSRGEDNGQYVGHDEPITRFLSSQRGSGSNVTWTEQLPRDPARRPTVSSPGHDRTHWFELSVAPWFSMALCNPESYPQHPCTPRSDSNAPTNPPGFLGTGGGVSFLEAQFYPPGFGPFADNISCDNTHWCASLHINDLECNADSLGDCNNNCVEPTNFAFIQTNGVPTGPPSPQLSNTATVTPNRFTLLMNPGDRIRVHLFDAPVPGGGGAMALKEVITDLTTGQVGFMQASAVNGYMATSISDCSGTPFNYQPSYSTAKPRNIVNWAALETNISTEFEIGHFEPCTRVSNPRQFPLGSWTDTIWTNCQGPYERSGAADGGSNPEQSSAPCFPLNFTHHGHSPPNLVAGCTDSLTQNGDLDFDGTSYWPDWPRNVNGGGTFPSPFLQEQPRSQGQLYDQIQFQTDAPASEASCMPSGAHCAVPPPGGPSHFYPFWTQARTGGRCVWEFGQMRNGNAFGRTKQYGKPSAYFFGNLESAIMPLPTCST